MKKSVFVFAVIALGCSSSFAAEVKKHNAPVVKATTMSDAQMDKVTAGNPGGVQGWAWGTVKGDGNPAYVAFEVGFPGRHNIAFK